MIKFLLWVYTLSYGANEKNQYKYKNWIKWIVCVCTFVIIKECFYYYMKIRGFLRTTPNLGTVINDDIIVSLTSFPARINNVWMVVDSICRQKMRPSSINLYLASEEFPNKDKDLPHNLERYKKYGLKVIWVPINLKPHKKYFYAFQEYLDKAVITIDDDVYYRSDLTSRLWNMSQKSGEAICANRVTPILNNDMQLSNYNQWGKDVEVIPGKSFNYLAIGTCGILYPPGTLRNSEVFNIDSINRNCLNADDLWLKCHEILNDVPVMTGDFYCQSIEIMGSQIISLRSTNCNTVMSGNDIQWNNLDKEYSITGKLRSLVSKEIM